MRRLVVAILAALALPSGAAAQAFAKEDTTIVMDDGVGIATTLYTPEGGPPANGWPAVMMFHGIGESRTALNAVGISLNSSAEQYLANQGYVVLTFDLRGHGASGGLFGLNGPRELADVRALFAWLAARPGVDGRRVGAYGYSLGGGLVWLAAANGVPFAAIETLVTWTDLETALLPQGLAKHGVLFGFLNAVPAARTIPEIQTLAQAAFRGENIPALRAFARERSVRPVLDRIRVPVLMMQGRRDFAFDLEQAIAAFRRLQGPKRLYFGNFGHTPSPKPPAEIPYAMTQARMWFDRFLKGALNGIDTRPRVELAPDPWSRRTRSYAAIPATRTMSFSHVGARTIGADGRIVRTWAPLRRTTETFGASVVQVTASRASGWRQLVAVLSAVTPARQEIVVAAGGVPTATLGQRPRRLAIRLLSQATKIPRGSSLRLTLASSSAAQNPANLLYLKFPAPPGARITLGGVRLRVPVLRTAISP